MFENQYKQPDAAQIEQEVNRWLKNKKLMTDFVKDLPSYAKTCTELEKRIWRGLSEWNMSDVRGLVIRTFLQENPDNDLPFVSLGQTRKERESHLWYTHYTNLFMLDVRKVPETHSLELFSWLNEEHSYLSFQIQVKAIGDPDDPDGDFNPDSAVAVSLSGAFPMGDELLALGKKALEMDYIDRWKMGSIQFRKKNPICPYCGGRVDSQYINYNSDRAKMVCVNDCGWEMRRSTFYTSEMTEQYVSDFFDTELKHIKSQLFKESEADKRIDEIEKCLNKLSKLYSKTSEGRPIRRKKILELVDQYMDLPDHNKQRRRN